MSTYGVLSVALDADLSSTIGPLIAAGVAVAVVGLDFLDLPREGGDAVPL
jgi:hypothetical protein